MWQISLVQLCVRRGADAFLVKPLASEEVRHLWQFLKELPEGSFKNDVESMRLVSFDRKDRIAKERDAAGASAASDGDAGGVAELAALSLTGAPDAHDHAVLVMTGCGSAANRAHNRTNSPVSPAPARPPAPAAAPTGDPPNGPPGAAPPAAPRIRMANISDGSLESAGSAEGATPPLPGAAGGSGHGSDAEVAGAPGRGAIARVIIPPPRTRVVGESSVDSSDGHGIGRRFTDDSNMSSDCSLHAEEEPVGADCKQQ